MTLNKKNWVCWDLSQVWINPVILWKEEDKHILCVSVCVCEISRESLMITLNYLSWSEPLKSRHVLDGNGGIFQIGICQV